MQSEKPNVAKKAEENKIFAKPTPQAGSMMVSKSDDQHVAARLGNEPEEGVGKGAYSAFLHEWANNIAALYNPPPTEDGCSPEFALIYYNGHVVETEPVNACGVASQQAFQYAIMNAPKPPMPTSFAGQQIPLIFWGAGRYRP